MKKCSLPYTAVNCVTKIITEMCVFEVSPDGLLLTELNPVYTIDDVKSMTEADFEIAEQLQHMSIA